MSNIQKINFNNQQLLTVEKDGAKYVAVKPICKNLGLAWGSQRKRIDRDDVLSSVKSIMIATGSDDKNYEMVCLPIDYINGFLFGIDTSRVSEEIRPVVLYYKRECYKALLAHWKAMRAILYFLQTSRRSCIFFSGNAIYNITSFIFCIK